MSLSTLKRCRSEGESSADSDQPLIIGGRSFSVEVATQIFQRLPVKALKRLECVSRTWLALISSPKFIRAHLDFSKSVPENHRLFLAGEVFPHRFRSGFPSSRHCSLGPILSGNHDGILADAVDREFPPTQWRYKSVGVVGCCDGLLCYLTGLYNGIADLHLWNPSTGKSHKLPVYSGSKRDDVTSYGFGYDCSADDYKVVLVIFRRTAPDLPVAVAVYSIKTQSWKRIQDFPRRNPEGHPRNFVGAFLNGKLHWAPINREPIVALDLATESYGEVACPFDHHQNDYYDIQLTSIGGNLSLLYDYQDVFPAQLWVMTEYGNQESWTHVASIPRNVASIPRNNQYTDLHITPFVAADGEYLLVYDAKVGLYNPQDHSFSPCNELVDIYIESAHWFVPSLVSPNLQGGEAMTTCRRKQLLRKTNFCGSS